MISKGELFQMAVRLKIICFIIFVWNIILIEGLEKANYIAETIHGDIYDCVDIYKQPSLLHPKLDKERIKESIAKALERQKMKVLQSQKNEKSIGFKAEEYWLNKKGCPIGTVPIRRMTKEQEQRAKYASMKLANQSLIGGITDFAGIGIVPPPKVENFTAISAIITLYNPHLKGPGQYSAASIYLERGIERIQAGWIVHPELYGDTQTRLYTHWTADDNGTPGCFNSICPGYVHTSNDIPIDFVFPNVTQTNSDNFELEIRIYQDSDFWVQLWDTTDIGYWPFYLFKEMKRGGKRARYGGEAYTPVGQKEGPEMGDGQYRYGLRNSTCYMRQVLYEGKNHIELSPDPSIVKIHQSRCYYAGNEKNSLDDHWIYNFIFGGDGIFANVPPPP